jgi:hypothetical protein
MDHLDRDRTSEHSLLGPIHAPHTPNADQIQHDVRARDGATDQRVLGRIDGTDGVSARSAKSVVGAKRTAALRAEKHHMQDTRTRTSTKASASSARGRARFEVLLLGANVAWIGVFWPWLLRGSTATWDVVVAVLGPGALWLGTLPETGTQAEQADEKSSSSATGAAFASSSHFRRGSPWPSPAGPRRATY